jgi:ribosomal protein L29
VKGRAPEKKNGTRKDSQLSDDELKSEQAKAAEQLFRIRFQKSWQERGRQEAARAQARTSPASRPSSASAR